MCDVEWADRCGHLFDDGFICRACFSRLVDLLYVFRKCPCQFEAFAQFILLLDGSLQVLHVVFEVYCNFALVNLVEFDIVQVEVLPYDGRGSSGLWAPGEWAANEAHWAFCSNVAVEAVYWDPRVASRYGAEDIFVLACFDVMINVFSCFVCCACSVWAVEHCHLALFVNVFFYSLLCALPRATFLVVWAQYWHCFQELFDCEVWKEFILAEWCVCQWAYWFYGNPMFDACFTKRVSMLTLDWGLHNVLANNALELFDLIFVCVYGDLRVACFELELHDGVVVVWMVCVGECVLLWFGCGLFMGIGMFFFCG